MGMRPAERQKGVTLPDAGSGKSPFLTPLTPGASLKTQPFNKGL